MLSIHENYPGKGCGGEDGFTLIELIIVSTLAVIFLTLSIPALKGSLLVNDLDATARKVVGLVRGVRNLAVREYVPYLIHFELEQGRIWYEPDKKDKEILETGEAEMRLPDNVRLDKVWLASAEMSDEIASQKSVTLWISRQGYMDQMAVHVSDDNNQNVTIIFSPFSGSASVYGEYVEVE